MKSLEDLRKAFTATGLDLARPIVTTCGSGVSALVLTLALYRLGVRGSALYDGSWSEWACPTDRRSLPVRPERPNPAEGAGLAAVDRQTERYRSAELAPAARSRGRTGPVTPPVRWRAGSVLLGDGFLCRLCFMFGAGSFWPFGRRDPPPAAGPPCRDLRRNVAGVDGIGLAGLRHGDRRGDGSDRRRRVDGRRGGRSLLGRRGWDGRRFLCGRPVWYPR